MKFRTPLSRARGLGSAKEGTAHWWAQRLTAIALIPLTLWMVWSIIALMGADYGAARTWVARPLNATLLLLMIYALFHHSSLGLQVIIEDYVHVRWLELTLVITIRFLNVALGVVSALAVLRVGLGA